MALKRDIMLKRYYENEDIIKLKPIIRSEEEATELSEKLKISLYSAKRDIEWFCINGEYYRFKFFDSFYPILNELVGPKIAKTINLKTVENIPAILEYNPKLKFYGILSKNFMKPDCSYVTMYQLGFKHGKQPTYKNFDKFKKFCHPNDYYENVKSIFKMTCLDYIMEQVDRVGCNFLFEKRNESLSFAPLFDYAEAYGYAKKGCSFNKKENPYLEFSVGNVFVTPTLGEFQFKRLLKKEPQFNDTINTLSRIDLIKILKEIRMETKLKITEHYFEHYDSMTKEKQKRL